MVSASNKISGTVSAEMSKWSSLSLFSVFGNDELEVDLGAFRGWREIEYVLMHECNIRGTLPDEMLSIARELKALIMVTCHLSSV